MNHSCKKLSSVVLVVVKNNKEVAVNKDYGIETGHIQYADATEGAL
jgi:hypothetical protein